MAGIVVFAFTLIGMLWTLNKAFEWVLAPYVFDPIINWILRREQRKREQKRKQTIRARLNETDQDMYDRLRKLGD